MTSAQAVKSLVTTVTAVEGYSIPMNHYLTLNWAVTKISSC